MNQQLMSHKYVSNLLLPAYCFSGEFMSTNFTTNPIALSQLLQAAHQGQLQLPDFQRSWI